MPTLCKYNLVSDPNRIIVKLRNKSGTIANLTQLVDVFVGLFPFTRCVGDIVSFSTTPVGESQVEAGRLAAWLAYQTLGWLVKPSSSRRDSLLRAAFVASHGILG